MDDKVKVDQLISGYRQAAVALDAIPDPVERNVGQAALASNSAATLRHLSTRGQGLDDDEMAALRQWVTDYSGEGGVATKVLDKIDSWARKAASSTLTQVATWAWTGNVPVALGGVLAFITGLALAIMDIGDQFMASLLKAFAAGAIPSGLIYLAVRSSTTVGPAAVNSVRTSWSAASALGSRAAKILNETSVPAERSVWTSISGAAYPGLPFIDRSRSRAQTVVGCAIAAAVVGATFFAIGAIRAYDEWSAATGTIG